MVLDAEAVNSASCITVRSPIISLPPDNSYVESGHAPHFKGSFSTE
jgi:hypothetical protein